ncbi:hypothetical protein [Helicobacter sp. 11S02629-2]|uniref:hypothetical protein n=1 Tax=Helicobacter sp. 11S02629-2 TaxID=1476195 RepID=UPI000BA7C9C4|nr:hypothetical protein [Helicobacter sp. 11S02629-2]PAF45981.1 hypothetical protein BKH40_00790 [Helicobacter sp. 11S02629-2]
MLRFIKEDVSIGLIELPDFISLIIPLSGCGQACPRCHSKHLQNPQNGEILSLKEFESLYLKYKEKVEVICFFGSASHLEKLDKFIFSFPFKYALYCGQDLDISQAKKLMLKHKLSFLKIGSFKYQLGALDSKTTNQKLLFFDSIDGDIKDITYKFHQAS